MVVQANIYGPDLPRAELPRIEKRKQRSVTIDNQELEVDVDGARVGPKPYSGTAQVARKKNLL